MGCNLLLTLHFSVCARRYKNQKPFSYVCTFVKNLTNGIEKNNLQFIFHILILNLVQVGKIRENIYSYKTIRD